MAKLLLDECLHASLLELAHAAGHIADHVNYLGLAGAKDWELMTLFWNRTTSSSRTIERIFCSSTVTRHFTPGSSL